MKTGYGYLMHSAKGSTWSKKEHKYLTREWKDGKWVYYYSNKKQGKKERVGRQMVYTIDSPNAPKPKKKKVLGDKQYVTSQVLRHEDNGYGYLIHSAKGSTWSKSGAKYDKRYWKNGKWYYVYGEKMKKKAQDDERRRNQREKLLKEGEQYRHEQYLKDQQIAKNRERQAKILKGKTGGVVNSTADKKNIKTKYTDKARDRERGFRERSFDYYKLNKNDKKKNATKYEKSKEQKNFEENRDISMTFAGSTKQKERFRNTRNNEELRKAHKIAYNENVTNTSKGGYIYNDETGKYEYKLKPKDWKGPTLDEFIEAQRKGELNGKNWRDVSFDWDAKKNSEYSEDDYYNTSKRNKRLSDAADRAAKTKKLNSKSYQLKNKAEGKVKTLKKKISK